MAGGDADEKKGNSIRLTSSWCQAGSLLRCIPGQLARLWAGWWLGRTWWSEFQYRAGKSPRVPPRGSFWQFGWRKTWRSLHSPVERITGIYEIRSTENGGAQYTPEKINSSGNGPLTKALQRNKSNQGGVWRNRIECLTGRLWKTISILGEVVKKYTQTVAYLPQKWLLQNSDSLPT